MAKRKIISPSGRGSPVSNTSFIMGLTCGMALGALATFSLFTWLPGAPSLPDTTYHITTEGLKHVDKEMPLEQPSLPDVKAPQSGVTDIKAAHPVVPDIKTAPQPLVPDKLIRMGPSDGAESILQAAKRNVEPPKTVKPVDSFDKTSEGARLISYEEQNGGWRLVPEVLEIAKKYPGAEVISAQQPLIVLLRGFLSLNETEHMVELASTHMARSKVVADPKNKKEEAVSNVRTSFGAWLNHNWRDNVVETIEARIHTAVGIPREFGEGIYVLRYEKEQKYDPHTDNCAKKGEKPRSACLDFLKRSKGPKCGDGFGGASCGDRIATVIMYLRSPDEGGETVFPSSAITRERLRTSEASTRKPYWFCSGSTALKVTGHPGDAVLFWDYAPRSDITNHTVYQRTGAHGDDNMDTEAVNDPAALHGGCPVLEGEKWIATRWIRSSRFN